MPKREKTMKKICFFSLMLIALVIQPAWGTEPQPEPQPEQLMLQGPAGARQVSFQQVDPGKLLVSVTDEQDNPVMGLSAKDFSIHQGIKTAKITQVEPLATSKDVGLNIVLVVDNSYSMRERKAIEPLLQALEAVYGIIRPIDNLAMVVYDDQHTIPWSGRQLHAHKLQSNDIGQLRTLVKAQMTHGLTSGTYLYDAVMAGLDTARQWPDKSNKFMVVLTDGEDLNSVIKRDQVLTTARNIPNFWAYTVDYMPTPSMDDFLKTFAHNHGGHIWKASSAGDLVPIFKAFSSTLLHRYVVSYRFLNPPSGVISMDPSEISIEEITTIDSAPLLNYVFFDTGRSELPSRYAQFQNQAETENFSETALTGVMEKYTHLLNIIGRRLRTHPDATVRLVGCNSNTGEEARREDLSRSRAEAVKAYLRYVWGIAPERMSVEARDLPEAPSTNRIPEGQAENQRVEIQSDDAAILDTVKSEYVEKVSPVAQIRVSPQITAEAGIRNWKCTLTCGDQVLGEFSGEGEPTAEYTLPLEKKDLDLMAAAGSVTARLQVTDKESESFESSEPAVLPVHFIQRQEQMAQKQGYKVREKYALILFDYDSAAIKSRNKIIVDRIAERMKAVPDAAVQIVGHTDTIGKEAYNLQLSQKRAEAVQAQFGQVQEQTAAPALTINAIGAGPNDPLYDNQMPEGRALNRTVTIALEYEQQ
jgi:outer membrane protein OmpA-like peptidoglycan-associated protein/Mg-chelatase subunit ChlD